MIGMHVISCAGDWLFSITIVYFNSIVIVVSYWATALIDVEVHWIMLVVWCSIRSFFLKLSDHESVYLWQLLLLLLRPIPHIPNPAFLQKKIFEIECTGLSCIQWTPSCRIIVARNGNKSLTKTIAAWSFSYQLVLFTS